jgi:putative NADH-flavin reductase
MRVTIFGATRGTGRIVAEKCVAAGFEVTALVRDPVGFDLKNRVRVVVGDARGEKDGGAAMREAIGSGEGRADAVMSTLGAKSPFENSDLLAKAVPLMVGTMKAAGVERLIVLGAGGWQPGALNLQTGLRRWFFDVGARTLLRFPIEAQKAQEAAVVPSGLEWTVVAPSRLTNGKPKGVFRTDTEALPPKASQISRGDVATVMMQALEERSWIGQRVYVTW